MEDSLGVLYNQDIEDFGLLLNILRETEYSDRDTILQVEQQVYTQLKKNGEDVNGLVVLALIQIMLGNRQKALAVAHNIWDIGGDFADLANIVYIDILLNLGLFDMALMLLKPKIEEFGYDFNQYFYVMLKFAILTGNANLISKLLNLVSKDDDVFNLKEFMALYKEENYIEHFRNIQQIITQTCKDIVCAYEYGVFTDRGFVDLEIFIYLGKEESDIDFISEKLEKNINKYCHSKEIRRIYNLSFTVTRIEEHPVALS